MPIHEIIVTLTRTDHVNRHHVLFRYSYWVRVLMGGYTETLFAGTILSPPLNPSGFRAFKELIHDINILNVKSSHRATKKNETNPSPTRSTALHIIYLE